MYILKKIFILFLIILLLFSESSVLAIEPLYETKFPDYSRLYVGNDKYEHYNRKMFNFNLGVNKYVIRPVHTIWTSVVPKSVIDHIQMAYNNIEYPKRLVSTMIQKDYKHSKNETKRFFINLTLGLGGFFDPAEKVFKIEGVNEDMEQALAKRHVRSGNYLILPVLTPTNTRNIAGSILDTALNPTTYLFFSGFIVTAIKAGILVNRTSRYQPLAKMLESNYADTYDMTKKLYGLEKYILIENYDRKDVLDEIQNTKIDDEQEGIVNVASKQNISLKPDIQLNDFYPAGPVTDSLRTSLFNDKTVYKSVWAETSIWNRSFAKRIKTGKISLYEDRPAYHYRYILQKNKNAPIVILYPSIGEGRTSSHSVVFGKMFYDRGYSVLIMGSQFQWEFKRSMPSEYKPGIPSEDIKYLRKATADILTQLEKKYDKNFTQKTVLGTSLGALMTLELANAESTDNTMNITKYIAICPPTDLNYAMKQFDNNSQEWVKFSDNLEDNVAFVAAKVANAFLNEKISENNLSNLKFSEDEAKLITGYVMHQKLSDLIYETENKKGTDITSLYKEINNTNFQDYIDKYIDDDKKKLADLENNVSIFHISDYLKNANNYIIYHSSDDYLVNTADLKKLKDCSGKKLILMSNGAHLGFMYRQEFKDSLISEIPVAGFNPQKKKQKSCKNNISSP